jgi:hypothetical protein
VIAAIDPAFDEGSFAKRGSLFRALTAAKQLVPQGQFI